MRTAQAPSPTCTRSAPLPSIAPGQATTAELLLPVESEEEAWAAGVLIEAVYAADAGAVLTKCSAQQALQVRPMRSAWPHTLQHAKRRIA